MKNLILLFVAILCSYISLAQCAGPGLLASSDFNSPYTGMSGWGADFVSSVGDCSNGAGDDVFGIVPGDGTWNSITSPDGSDMWGFRDVDGDCGTAAGETLTFEFTIPAGATYTEVEMCFDYTVVGFDGGDDIFATVNVDGAAACAAVDGIQIVDGDANLNVAWTTHCFTIPVVPGNVVQLVILVDQNGASDFGAIDNVCLNESSGGTLDCEPALVCPNPGDLMITEIMYDADGTDTGAEWVEVCNTTASDIDMNGMVLSNSGATDNTITTSLIVPAGGCIVLATGTLGCGAAATPDYVWSGFSLGNTADNFEILCSGTTIDIVAYDEAAGWPVPNQGGSIQFDLDATQNSTENDLAANWCVSDAICAGVSTGTPGATNTSCNLCTMPGSSAISNSTSFVTGAVGTTGDPDPLDDACIAAQESADCGAGETFVPTYGTISWDGSVGAITGLETTDGVAYTGTVEFDVFEVIQACAGTGEMGTAVATHTANTTVSSSTTSMQGDSPKPTGIGGHFTENDGGSSGVNQVCMTFSVPVDFVSFFIGDVESSDVTPGYIHVYDSAGDLMSSDAIPTATPVGDQAIDCTGGTGGAGFDGCGNDETVFVKLESPSADIGKICIEVGDFPDDTAAPGGTEHISFGGLSLGGVCELIVPVTLSDFTARQRGVEAVLNWVTESEMNNDLFEIEWSRDGREFSKIGEIAGFGTSNETLHYEFLHKNPVSGKNYYRLKQIDFNGNYEYSDKRIVNFDMKEVISFRPQIINDVIYFYSQLEEPIQVQLYSMDGKIVLDEQFSGEKSFSLSDLNAGMYLIRMTAGTQVTVDRVIKK